MAAEVLIWLAIALVIVTLVGHGIWVILAIILRAMFGKDQTAIPARDCPVCGKRKVVIAGHCRNCAATPLISPSPGLAPHDETWLVIRRLEKLLASGGISREEFEKLELLLLDDVSSPFASSSPAVTVASPNTPVANEASDAVTPVAVDRTTPTDATAGGTGVLTTAPDGDAVANDDIFDAELIDDSQPRPASPPPLQPHPPLAQPPVSPIRTAPAAVPIHPLDGPEPTGLAPRVSTPRRTLAALLQSFMEEKNIRWGEIISGLLIVVCAVGLVVSLWATLRDSIPYLPALIFMVGTAAFHAVGHYTLRKWDLSSISRAVLIIATLLIPLNFLAAIALSGNADEHPPWTDPTYLLAVVVGLAAYGTMTFFAGRAFLGADWWRLVAGVMGPCIGQLIINRLARENDSDWRVWALVTIPLAGFLLATVSGLLRGRRWKHISLRRAEPLFLTLGIATFALLGALALMVVKSNATWATLAQLSPAISLAAGTILATGLLIHQRTSAAKLYALRMTGTSLALSAAFGLLICILLAWPDPELLIAVGTLNAMLLAAMGFLVSLPALHGFAIATGGLAWIVAYHYLSNTYESPTEGREIVRSFFTGQSAAALGVFAALLGGLATRLTQIKLQRDAIGYYLGAAAVLAISGLLAVAVGFAGLPSSYIAPLTLGIYAVALTGVAWQVGDGRIAGAGSAVLLVALVQACGFIEFYHDSLAARGIVLHRPVLFAFLAHGVLCAAVGVGAGRLDAWMESADGASRRWLSLVKPFTESALATTLLAAPWALFVSDFEFGFQASYLGTIAVVWLSVAVVRRWPVAFMVSHIAFTISLVAAVAAVREVDSWRACWEPLHTASTLLVLSAWCMLAVLGRWFCRRWPPVRQLFEYRDWPAVDRMVVGVMIATLVGTLVVNGLPGMLREIGWGNLADDVSLPDRQQAFEVWMWVAWFAVLAAVATTIWERITRLGFESLVLACVAVPLLVAGPHEMDAASLSAVRWTLAVFGLAVTACWSARHSIYKLAQRRDDWPGLADPETEQMPTIPMLVVVISAIPVVTATTLTVLQVVGGASLGGPQADSFFAHIGPAWSYGTPLALVATTLLMIAVRDARPRYALGGSVVVQYLASLACLLPPLTAGQQLTGSDIARLGQWNALALGSYGLVWLALRNWIEPAADSELAESAGDAARPANAVSSIGVRGQVGASLAAVVVLAVAAAGGIVASPGNIHIAYLQLGHWTSFLALGLAVASAVWLDRGVLSENGAHLVSGAGVCLAALIAIATGPHNLSANWLSFHVLLVGWTLVVTSAVMESWWHRWGWLRAVARDDSRAAILIAWSSVVGALVAALSVYAAAQDPTGPWWACGATTTLALAAGAAALRVRRQSLANASILLLVAAVTFVWLGTPIQTDEVMVLAHWWILAMTLGSGCWLAVEVNSQRRHAESYLPDSKGISTHVLFATLALVGLLATTFLGAMVGALQRGFGSRQAMDPSTWWGLAAVGMMGVLLFALLWDRRTRVGLLSLYLWGLAAQVMSLDALSWRVDNTMVALSISLAAYVALTGAFWRRGANLAAIGMRLGISDPVSGLRRAATWLPMLSVLASGFALLCGLVLVLAHPDRPQRVLTATVGVLIAIGLGCLAQSTRKQAFQFTALLMLGISCVFLSWADIEPGWNGGFWLSRVIRLLIVCCAVAFAYTMIVARRRDLSADWQMSLKRAGVTAGAGALFVLACVLIFECLLYLDNPTLGAPISDIQLGAVSVVMVGLVAALIAMAVLPGRDPMGLSEQGRTAYVYAAQVAGALLFAHIFLTRPYWFGIWGEYWPYIILLIAFAGAGVGELFQRTGHRVLAEPLQQTGTFLPLLPAIGMWMVASNSDYSMYLFGAGILYVGLSLGRKSMASALAAVVAANGALWSFLDDRAFVLFDQPQLWLIPPALSMLIAAEINRRRLPEAAMISIRYAGMMVIYLSSAGEIFIQGIGQALWPPMVLLGLSLLGAMAGIVLRIRAFLYLGITFILLSMISMVWHAARSIDHVWPWWAFGIGLGLCILVFFGFFEKNRDKMMALVEELKAWER